LIGILALLAGVVLAAITFDLSLGQYFALLLVIGGLVRVVTDNIEDLMKNE
jgi:hypothetical protein